MTACWIGVASGKHVATGRADGFAMFAHGDHAAAKRLDTGDWVAYYAPREGSGEGAELRAFTAIGQVLPGGATQREMAAGRSGWMRRMKWLDSRDAGIYPLLDKFSFIRDRQHWGMAFRKSLFKVAEHDFRLIAEAMGVSLDDHAEQ